MLSHPVTFVPNDEDNLHCFQASVRMAWQGLTGNEIGPAEAEELTGFEPGSQSWSFAGMLALANEGFELRSIEDFSPQRFADDPRSEIVRQTGDAGIADHIYEVSDVERQKELARECVASSNITFEERIPTYAELREIVAQPSVAVICNVNYRALVGENGYNGHFVLVTSADEHSVGLHNPGLPPIESQRVSAERFLSSWSLPNPSMANVLAIAAPA